MAPMRLKSYFSRDVQSALLQARQELGPDAMLVESRPAPPEVRHLGDYEVVFAIAPPEGERAAASGSAPLPEAPQPYSRFSDEISELRKELERLSAAVHRSTLSAELSNGAPLELAAVFAKLVENDVDPELAHNIVERVRVAGPPRDASELRRAVETEIRKRIRSDSSLGRGPDRPRVVALVGPCGAGKTSTLVKLAVRYGVTAHLPLHILSIDAYRVAAAEQLRSYAAILGVAFELYETPGALAQAIDQQRRKDLIFIDTPGHSLHDLDACADLARFLASRSDIDTHLVLTASMKSADVSRVVDAFEIFRPRKLLFTRLDETGSFGAILNEAARTTKPVSFLASGQQIPEDLEAASEERLVRLLLREEEKAERAAAA